LTLSPHEQRCGQEFNELANEVVTDGVPRIDHSAAYLNWRYLDNPTAKFRFVTARSNGELRGYAVYTSLGEDATLVDLFGTMDPEVLGALVNYLCIELADSGVQTLSAPLSDSHPYGEILHRLGFQKREPSPIVVIGSNNCPTALGQLSTIPFMQGDRDS